MNSAIYKAPTHSQKTLSLEGNVLFSERDSRKTPSNDRFKIHPYPKRGDPGWISRQHLPLRAVTANGTFEITGWNAEGFYTGVAFMRKSKVLNVKFKNMSFNSIFKSTPERYWRYIISTTMSNFANMKFYHKWISKIQTKLATEHLLPLGDRPVGKSMFKPKGTTKQTDGLFGVVQALLLKIRCFVDDFVRKLMKFVSIDKIAELTKVLSNTGSVLVPSSDEDEKPSSSGDGTKDDQDLDTLEKFSAFIKDKKFVEEGTPLSRVQVYNKWREGIDVKQFLVGKVETEFAPNYEVWETYEYRKMTTNDPTQLQRLALIDQVRTRRHEQTMLEIKEKKELDRIRQELALEKIQKTHELAAATIAAKRELEDQIAIRKGLRVNTNRSIL